MDITDDDVIKYIVSVANGQAKQAALLQLAADKVISDPADLAFIKAVLGKFPL